MVRVMWEIWKLPACCWLSIREEQMCQREQNRLLCLDNDCLRRNEKMILRGLSVTCFVGKCK